MQDLHTLVTFTNADAGLEATVNLLDDDSFRYRVICRDTDADETAFVINCPSYEQAYDKAREFAGVEAS